MKKLRRNSCYLSLILLLISCTGGESAKKVENNTTSEAAYPVVANARDSLKWTGTYQRVLPCSRCEGLSVFLELHRDLSYLLRTRRLGIDNMDKKESGSFSWTDASHIRLNGQSALTFRVGDDFLEQTLKNGKGMGTQYILEKTND